MYYEYLGRWFLEKKKSQSHKVNGFREMVGAGSRSQDSVWTQVGQTWLSNMTDEDSVTSFRISALRRPERTGQVHMRVNLIRKRARPACPRGPRSTVSPQIPLMAQREGWSLPASPRAHALGQHPWASSRQHGGCGDSPDPWHGCSTDYQRRLPGHMARSP